MSQHACNEPSFVWWGGTVTWPWMECALRSLSWVVTQLSRSITTFHLFPLHTGMWETTQDGRISGLWQCNSFSLLKAKWPHALGLRRPRHAAAHICTGVLIVAVIRWGAPNIYVYLCCQCSEAGVKTSCNARDSPAQENCLDSRVSHSDQLTGGKSHFNMF